MVTVLAEGVDYSSTYNDDWDSLAQAIVDEGKTFVGRYAVHDKSPGGRGITNAEYLALRRKKLNPFLYYEETEGWMTGGFDAGVRGAKNAMDVIRAEGLPQAMPVGYSDDQPPEDDDFGAVIDCLRGVESVVGHERVGFYGGWDSVDAVMRAGAASKYVQTLGWQGSHGLHEGIHLHQWGFNHYLAGTNCDYVAALRLDFGGAADYLDHPSSTTTPHPRPHPINPPELPKGMSIGVARGLFNPKKVKRPDTGTVVGFARGGEVTEFWIARGLASIPPGGTWKDGDWPALFNIVKRGDGRLDYQFATFVYERAAS